MALFVVFEPRETYDYSSATPFPREGWLYANYHHIDSSYEFDSLREGPGPLLEDYFKGFILHTESLGAFQRSH